MILGGSIILPILSFGTRQNQYSISPFLLLPLVKIVYQLTDISIWRMIVAVSHPLFSSPFVFCAVVKSFW